MARGSSTDRAAFTPDIPTPGSGPDNGYYWFEEDTNKLYAWNNTGSPGWVQVIGSGAYSDEQAQDAVGGILTDTATIDFTYNDGSPSITADVKAASITEAMQILANNTTNNVTSTKHGYAPIAPADATQFLNGAATAAWAAVKDSDLSTSDITTNNVTSSKHGFAPKSPADATQFLNGAATPAFAAVKDSDLSTSDITTNNVSTSKHGFAPKLPNDATKYLDGTGAYSVPAGGSTPAKVLITEAVTTSSASNVTFSSISSSYRDLEIRVRGRGDTAATSVTIQIQLNSDTGNNYDWEVENRFGTGNGNGVAFMRLGDIPAASATANYAGGQTITIYDYKGTTFYKSIEGIDWLLTSQSSANMFNSRSGGWWRSTSAVNAVKVYLSAGNFVDNSVVSLYGLL